MLKSPKTPTWRTEDFAKQVEKILCTLNASFVCLWAFGAYVFFIFLRSFYATCLKELLDKSIRQRTLMAMRSAKSAFAMLSEFISILGNMELLFPRNMHKIRWHFKYRIASMLNAAITGDLIARCWAFLSVRSPTQQWWVAWASLIAWVLENSGSAVVSPAQPAHT